MPWLPQWARLCCIWGLSLLSPVLLIIIAILARWIHQFSYDRSDALRTSSLAEMAELGIVASALQIADIGIHLSLRLYTFGETVAGADKSIISISKDVSLTSTVLKELGQTLEKDQTARICSPNAVQTAESIAKECQRIFQDMDQVLVKKFANTRSTEKDRRIKAAQTLERLRWPFIKGKIELLTSNLERQKSTLVLMLNVITLAKQEYERTEPYTIITEQRSLIQDLARSNEEYTRRFEQLSLTYEAGPILREPILADCNNTIPTPKVPTARGWASASAVGAARQRESSTGAQGFGPGPYMGSWYLHGSDTSLPNHLSWLQQQYRNLMNTLLIEVSAPSYEIADDSRSRIKAEIVTIHIREMRHMEEIQYSRPIIRAREVEPMAGPMQQIQAQQHTYSSQGAVDLSASKIDRDEMGPPLLYEAHYPMPQTAKYQNNSSQPLGAGYTSDSTCGEHEQTSAAQSWPHMASMSGAFPLPDGRDFSGLQQQSMGPMAATPQRGRSSSGVDPRATILPSGQRQSLSNPQPGIAIASPYEPSQALSAPQPYGLPHSAGAVNQESSLYGKSAGENDQRHAELPIVSSWAPPRGRKRKLYSTSHTSDLPVEDSISYSESKTSISRTSKVARRHGAQNPVVEDILTPGGGASDEMRLATSRQNSANKKASEDDAVYAQDEISRNLHRERRLERTLENHTPEDWAENVVDKLLAAWTTLPVSANRTAAHQGGFAVVAH